MTYRPRHARHPSPDELAQVSSGLAGLADLITVIDSNEEEN